MRSNTFRVLGVVVLLALTGLACSLTGKGGLSVGSDAPDFSLTTTTGKEASLGAFRGRPVVLNFFTTWCGPCRAEMPGMQAQFENHVSQGLVLLAVDMGDSPAEVKSYAKELGLSFPLLLDPENEVGDLYGVSSFPRTFFIDTEGVIRKVSIGSMEEEDIAEGIEDLLRLAREAKEKQVDASTGKGVQGCVNVGTALARTGPGKKHPAERKLHLAECFGFDARTPDGIWLRMADLLSEQGDRLWVQADYIDLKAGTNGLEEVAR